MGDLVSILIPAYNAERWIAQTIQSALDQTWSNKEIIVIDDGSRDKTLAVARMFESKSVRVETQDNMGACATRNRSLSLAQGDFIQWLDADDLLDPGKIRHQMEAQERIPGSRVLFTSAWGRFYFCVSRARFTPGPLWADLEPVEWMIRKFETCDWMNPTAWLVSRKLIDMAGLWDERLSLSGDDDGEYVFRLVAASDSCGLSIRPGVTTGRATSEASTGAAPTKPWSPWSCPSSSRLPICSSFKAPNGRGGRA